jgi:hypothetical protein
MKRRQRFDRVIDVTLECGCHADLQTCRSRVGAATKAVLVGHHARRGVWCEKHPGMNAIIEVGKVKRA